MSWRRSAIQQILLAIEDVTERVRLEREHAIAHGGKVERESGNKGTIVYLTLPSREAS
jgi:hypothetical protein